MIKFVYGDRDSFVDSGSFSGLNTTRRSGVNRQNLRCVRQVAAPFSVDV